MHRAPDPPSNVRHAALRAPITAMALLIAMAGAACVGSIGGGEGAGAPAPSADPAAPDPGGRLGGGTANADPQAAGLLPLRRLTTVEYVNTVRDLFGDPSITVTLPPDPAGAHGFSEAPLLSDDAADALRDTAEGLAARAVQKLDALVACDRQTSGDDGCARQFVTAFGRRAFRRPLTPDETSDLVALYTSARNDLKYGFDDAVRIVVSAFLQSPSFLYHWEVGDAPIAQEGSVDKLPPFQLASRISYLLWNSMPDDALLDAAAAGKLDTDEGLAAEIGRLMKSDKLAQSLATFHAQWLSLDADVTKDSNLYPDFSPALRASMEEETARFLRHVFLEGDGRLATLFTSTDAEVDPLMAKLYGVPAPASGWSKVQLDSTTRADLLTRAALLAVDTNAATTNPPRAGAKIWQKVLCQKMDPPPPGAAASFHFDAALSTRENFTKLESEPSCKGCHGVINPIGYAFEGFDAIGRARTMEGAHAVDTSGTLTSDPASPRHFASAVDLSATLASDPDVTSCVTRQWFRFAVERQETAADKYSLETAYQRFQASSFDVRALLQAVAESRTFRYRAAEAGEAP